uniref:Uncharacterized protein n=1 Tax=Peronospora matthiolae TaxID=2874970 RepID=A0AAV1V839_9STRA
MSRVPESISMLRRCLADWIIGRVVFFLKAVRFALLMPQQLNLWLCGRAVRAVLHPRQRLGRQIIVFRLFFAIVTAILVVTFTIVKISMKTLLCAVRLPPAMQKMVSSCTPRKRKSRAEKSW